MINQIFFVITRNNKTYITFCLEENINIILIFKKIRKKCEKKRPNIFVQAKFKARPIFEVMPKFGARQILRPKVRQGKLSGQANEARPGQVLQYALFVRTSKLYNLRRPKLQFVRRTIIKQFLQICSEGFISTKRNITVVLSSVL